MTILELIHTQYLCFKEIDKLTDGVWKTTAYPKKAAKSYVMNNGKSKFDFEKKAWKTATHI